MEYLKEYWFLISGIIIPIGTYLIGKQHNRIIKFKDRDDAQNEALMTMLQSNLTNTYFAYSTLRKIPDYVYQNWINELIVYENKLKDDTNTLIRESLEYGCDYCDSPIGNPIEINIKKKYCAIESFLNLVQSAVDLLYESGISAEDIINYYDGKRD